MPEAAIGLRVEIELETDAGAAELVSATTQLRHEILELDVDRVDLPAGAQSWVARRSSRSVKDHHRRRLDRAEQRFQQDQRRLLESFLARHAHGSP